MRISMTASASAHRRPGTGLPYLVTSGLLWGTGGLTGSLASSRTRLPLAALTAIATAPVIVLGVERATGRKPGRQAAGTTSLALIGLGLLVGLPSGFGETAVLASAGLAVLAAAGFAAVTLTRSRPGARL